MYRCEYCEGTVQPLTLKREAFKHRDGFVILEDVTIGVCDTCGNRYYCADISSCGSCCCNWSETLSKN
ncbi:YgiT-type zinc finger protein [Nostoc sp.]|uniref:YgiT-type zinc finger protein n=1 Tax=Nostoc sp. TaxID=1180 RepID=UPI003FA5A085